MRSRKYWLAAFLSTFTLAGLLSGQQTTQSSAIVPQLVNFSGKATNSQGKVITGIAGITFSIYSEQEGSAPLWMETQNVTADSKGNYTVQLGASKSEGLPLDLFSSGEARWLGVRINGGEEQPRVLLLSVPYALKAADAQTLGGLPASAFVLASPMNGSSSTAAHTSAKAKSAISASVGGTGTKEYISLWTSSTALGNSVLFQLGTKVGVNTITPAFALDVKGKVNASGGFELGGKNFAFGSYSNQNAFLGFAGNSSGAGTNNIGSGFQALFSNTTGSKNTAIGNQAMYSNTQGNFNTVTGDFALYGNSTGSDNTVSGALAMSSNTTGSYNTASGVQALTYNSTGSYNTGIGYLALAYNMAGSNNVATGYQALYSNHGDYNTVAGADALYYNTTGKSNTGLGLNALFTNSTGSYNTAAGAGALYENTSDSNTAYGDAALANNSTGTGNTAVGAGALGANTTGNYLTCVGFACTPSTGGLSNATAIGAHAVVSQSNSLVLGGTGEHAVKVGIGVTAPSNVLTIGRGLGHPVSDSWETYSSRRWKTNIQTLNGALGKVEHLRGVSYDLKDSGKHEIGVIAEEVGAVVPEVVSYEANGKDARGVDYSRLTALLIEAVKQQQKQISEQRQVARQQQKQIAAQQGQIAAQREQIRRLRSKDALLEGQLTQLQGKVDELRQAKRSVSDVARNGSAVIAKAQF